MLKDLFLFFVIFFPLPLSARMAGLQEDNKSLKLSLSKVEAERKQAQERSNNLEKVHAKRLLCAERLPSRS